MRPCSRPRSISEWLHNGCKRSSTLAFLIFFAVVFAIYWMVPRRWQMTRICVLVVASFHFYRVELRTRVPRAQHDIRRLRRFGRWDRSKNAAARRRP
ncbi:MAG: hypothetical protein U0792_12165 [Gemmataceae bacterium]